MILSYRYNLNVSAGQRRDLQAILDSQRWLYNHALSWKQFAWEVYRTGISYYDQCKWLTGLRDRDERAAKLPANIQRATLKRLYRAFAGFFRRCKRGEKPGYPRFRSADRFDSFGFQEFNGIRFDGRRVWFKGVRGKLRLNLHRPLPKYEKILGCTFRRRGKQWEISLQLRIEDSPKVEPKAAVGIDVGLTSLATLSTGEQIENPRHTKQAASELRVAQRALSRCHHGSNRRKKVKAEVSRCHETISNSRETYLHQVSRDLVNRFDLIAVEDLNVKGLVQGRLAKHIADAAWSRLRTMLSYKAEGAGKQVIAVDPKFTSQDCSGCGKRVPKELSERVHSCPNCGLVLDRDVNAARNILHAAVVGCERLNVGQQPERAAGILVSA